MKAIIRIAQVATGDLLLGDIIREGRELYAPNALKLTPNTPPVLVNHDRDRVIGRVLGLEEWDFTDGVWVVARCQLDDAPEWLCGGSRGSGASMGWANVGTSQTLPGGWTRHNRALVTEISVLSPSVQPAEATARVVTIKRDPAPLATPDPHGLVIWGDGRSLHRPGQIIGIR